MSLPEIEAAIQQLPKERYVQLFCPHLPSPPLPTLGEEGA
jgi:hypothetical protein